MSRTSLLVAVVAFVSVKISLGADCSIGNAFETGYVHEDIVKEASGLAASKLNPGVLYTHNDRGGEARVFAFYEDGREVAKIELEGVDAEDFEDIAVGPGPLPGLNYIYVGDIGNNDEDRDEVQIYRFLEPDLAGLSDDTVTIPSSEVARIPVTAPGKEDWETLMSDPYSGDLYFLQKNHDDPEANIYRINGANDVPEGAAVGIQPIFPDRVGIIPYEFLVAGDISADGRRILLRSGKNRGAWMWTRNPQEETVEDALMGPSSCNLQLHDEEQGEAIAVHVAGEGFYTTSEGEEAPIYYYQFL